MTGWSDVTGWWPSMVGPGLPFDTDKYFVVCPNVIGGCQGSTGPSSLAPDGKRYGSRFPSLTIRDMVAAEIAFTDLLGIKKYQLAVGPSIRGNAFIGVGGAVCHTVLVPSARLVLQQLPQAIRSAHASIELRAIKSDPNFNNGDYYDQAAWSNRRNGYCSSYRSPDLSHRGRDGYSLWPRTARG